MSFSATVQADILQDALDPVTALVNECKIRTNDMGVSITAVDPANVGMVDMGIHASAFASYNADGGVLGINLERLTEILGMADSDEMVDLELDEETRKLNIEMGGLSFTMALIDPESIREEPDIPDLELPAEYVFEGQELSRAVSAADLVSDHIELTARSEDVIIISAIGDTDDVVVSIRDEDLSSSHHASDGGERSLVSLDYLADMGSPIGPDTHVELRLGNEMPIKIEFDHADGDVSVTYMLAPRIQSD